MIESDVADNSYKSGILSEVSYTKICEQVNRKGFSIFTEVSLLLYAGIILLSTGIGMLLYVNRDSLGHTLIIALISIMCLACAAYCYRKKINYTPLKTPDQGMAYTTALIVGCLSFASLMGYIQYQFSIFGERNELLFALLAILFFTLAYRFDSISILSLAITSLASVIGIVITPTELLQQNDFSSSTLLYSGLALGIVIAFAAVLLRTKNIKAHFTYTYFHFALHLVFIAALSGLFTQTYWVLFIALLALLGDAGFKIALQEKSFYFLLCTVIYSYIAAGFFIVKLFSLAGSLELLFAQLLFFYFVGSSILTIRFLIQQRKIYSTLA
jgi:Predicted membrane protein (DUF2157)